jgi:uncharacterized integral membrane protein
MKNKINLFIFFFLILLLIFSIFFFKNKDSVVCTSTSYLKFEKKFNSNIAVFNFSINQNWHRNFNDINTKKNIFLLDLKENYLTVHTKNRFIDVNDIESIKKKIKQTLDQTFKNFNLKINSQVIECKRESSEYVLILPVFLVFFLIIYVFIIRTKYTS